MSIPERLETSVRSAVVFILELLFYAAGLIINAIRTFFLIILVIIGPLALGFSMLPGFEGTFSGWIARYIQIFLWLPIANILGSIISRFQLLMVEQDIKRLSEGGNIDGSDMGYMIFLLFGIISYLTIPSVATWVIESSGAGRALQAQTRHGMNAGRMASSAAGSASGGAVRLGKVIGASALGKLQSLR
jgi:conjugative transposon TraJ protein